MKPVWILGAGGHAKVVIATARAAGFEPVEVADDDRALWGSSVLGVPVRGALAPVLERPEVTAVLAIGSNRARHRLGGIARCAFATIVHPSSVVDATVQLGAGTVVFAGSVIQPDTTIGRHAIINTHSSIDHDCHLGDAVHVAPGVHVAGTVTIGEGSFLGIGVSIIPNRTIGRWTTIGAGATVIHDVPDDTVAVGVPARAR